MSEGALDKYLAESTCGLVSMATVEPHAPEFLWHPYLRRANLNLLRGNGGSGKTSLCFGLAAAISNGSQPAGMPGRLDLHGPRAVIYLGAEDGLPEYRNMLDRQGAKAEEVYVPNGSLPTLANTVLLESMIVSVKAALLIVDPVQALLPEGVDMNRANEIRPVLDGLRGVCRRTGCTVLLLEHLNKATKTANTYRGSGSMDFFNGSRSVLVTGWTPDGKRACGHLKSNGAAYGPAILFDIGPGGRLDWRGGDASMTGEDILTTRPRETASLAPNPYALLIAALPAETGVWEGTAAQAIGLAASLGIDGATSPEAFGKAVRTLPVDSVRCTARRTNRGNVFRLEVTHNG